MVPIVQAAVSLFGASLTAAPIAAPASSGLIAGAALPAGSDVSNVLQAPAPFGDLMSEAIGQVDQLERVARSSVEGLMSGTGVDVHQAMIATEKASMGFDLVLAVRNKALAAYQQVMGMQF